MPLLKEEKERKMTTGTDSTSQINERLRRTEENVKKDEFRVTKFDKRDISAIKDHVSTVVEASEKRIRKDISEVKTDLSIAIDGVKQNVDKILKQLESQVEDRG